MDNVRARVRDTGNLWCIFVPACIAASLMPREQLVTLYVKPYIRRFVQRKLSDASSAATDAVARMLWQELERILLLRIVCAVPDEPGQDRACWNVQLEVVTEDPAALDPIQRRRVTINSLLNKAFYSEFYSAVTYHCHVLGYNQRTAINAYRSTYGLTEDDLSMDSSERLYRKYKKKDRRRHYKKSHHACKPHRS